MRNATGGAMAAIYLQGFYLCWSLPSCPKREKSGGFGVGSCMCSCDTGAPALFCSSVHCAVRHPRIFQQNKETGDKTVVRAWTTSEFQGSTSSNPTAWTWSRNVCCQDKSQRAGDCVVQQLQKPRPIAGSEWPDSQVTALVRLFFLTPHCCQHRSRVRNFFLHTFIEF